MLNDYFDCVYVINLKRRPDRLEHIVNQFKKINTELPKKNKFAKRSALHNEFKSNVDTTGMTSAQKKYAKNEYFIEKMNKGR